MKVKVAAWGNCLGIRLPKHVSEELGLRAGAQLDLILADGGINLRAPKLPSSRSLLAEMVAEAKRLGPDLEPKTIEWRPDRGLESSQR